MNKIKQISSKILIFQIIIGLLAGCAMFNKKDDNAVEKDQVIVKKKRFEPNTYKRIEKYSKDSGGLFTQKEKDRFARNNILWKAALQTLSDLPILSASYDGGIISTDWYGNQTEQIRVSVLFTSNEISASSFSIKGFKKKCDKNLICSTTSTSDAFNNKIKNKIVNNLRQLKISQQTKK